MSLAPRGMSVQEAYRLFADKKFFVNRKYQRKLVWSEDEKRHLIDSIQQEMPIPLFMFARVTDGDDRLEVIDGMQRLNAIFSYLQHGFQDESGRCFDISQSNRAAIENEKGVFTKFPDEYEKLSPEECASLLEYQLAITVDTSNDADRINEVFGRINSGGRQLSPQEQRQAGLISSLSEFVRRLSLSLRGDESNDNIPLNIMPSVSFNTPKERQGYGINASDVFWCKHYIVAATALARSEDEQIVLDLAASILDGRPIAASREMFDEIFDPASESFSKYNTALTAYGEEKLGHEIVSTIGAVRKIFEAEEFVPFRDCVNKEKRNFSRTTFYAVFMAFHDLMFRQSQFPDNAGGVLNALNNCQQNMIMAAHHSKPEDRIKNVDVIKGLIQKHFVKMDVAAFGSASAMIVELENSLRRSKHESSHYEFKIGICRVDDDAKEDGGMIQKVSKIASAIANTDPDRDGFIYLGVADRKTHALRWEKICGSAAKRIGDVYFVGLEHDLNVLDLDISAYVKKLILGIQSSEIDGPLKEQLSACIDHAEYMNRPFVRIRVPKQNDLTKFGGKYFWRNDSETPEMTLDDVVSQSKRFA